MSQIELSWVEELRNRYLSSESVIFLLHGNVNDRFPWWDGSTFQFLSLSQYLKQMLQGKKDIIVDYNLSDGFEVLAKNTVSTVNSTFSQAKLDVLNSLNPTISKAFQEMERWIFDSDYDVGMILEYCETLLPDQPLHQMNEQKMGTLVKVQQWTKDPRLADSNNIIILTTENLSMVHKRFVSSSQVALIEIPFPSMATRTEFVQHVWHSDVDQFADGIGLEQFSQVCAGLTLLQIQSIIRRARQASEQIDFRLVNERKKDILEQECQGLVEFVAPKHNFSHVGGVDGLKNELMRIADAIKMGRINQVPMGMLFVGPMGTGKTYIAEAFAGESGLTCIKLKNFRERWVGSTEANFERILNVIKALGYVLLIIDEADRSLSASGGDNGVDSRVIAKLKEFMSNTEHRGRIVVVMMTNRPDKIDIDLKRPGRLDVKIPFFFPEDEQTCLAIFKAQTRKHSVVVADDMDWDLVKSRLTGYSAAEIEAVLLAAVRAGVVATNEEQPILQTVHVQQALNDVVPSRDIRMLAYMEMMAVFEASSRSMLPSRFQNLTSTQIQQRLDALRLELAGRL
jgi:ATP-dependent 26S proteasome regulatory subunit